MVESRDHLLSRKDDVFAALRALERDRAEGTIDDRAYTSSRRRYETEAAEVLVRLDRLTAQSEPPGGAVGGDEGRMQYARTNFAALQDRSGDGVRRTRTQPLALRGGGVLFWIGALALVAVAAAIFLSGALRARGSGPITGDARTVVSTPTSAGSETLAAAEKRVKLHPASVDAYLDLGNAYLNANQPAAADRAFVRAMTLGPGRPEATTMHALILAGSSSRPTRSLGLLTGVEKTHPSYSHAWLVDGLLSARSLSTIPRAIAAFRRFLVLAPHASVSPQVRVLLAGLERAERRPPARSRP
jgi:hypothetical protein